MGGASGCAVGKVVAWGGMCVAGVRQGGQGCYDCQEEKEATAEKGREGEQGGLLGRAAGRM